MVKDILHLQGRLKTIHTELQNESVDDTLWESRLLAVRNIKVVLSSYLSDIVVKIMTVFAKAQFKLL